MILDILLAQNPFAILGEKPDGSEADIRFVFTSEYDRQVYQAFAEAGNDGGWIVGELEGSQLPEVGGAYKIEVHAAVQGLLSLNELRQPLNTLNQPLNDLRGAAFDSIIANVLAQVKGEDYLQTKKYNKETTVLAYVKGEETRVYYKSPNDNGKGITYIRN